MSKRSSDIWFGPSDPSENEGCFIVAIFIFMAIVAVVSTLKGY